MPELKWTAWHVCEPQVRFPDAAAMPRAAQLALVLAGGQAFRWAPVPGAAGVWQGAWGGCVARLTLGEEAQLRWQAPVALERNVAAELPPYLAADRDFAALVDALPWRSDAVLARAIGVLPGLRLLKQPFGETLLCYLCSSTKRIEQIRLGCAQMATRFGRELAPGVHALPTWEELASVSEGQLRACNLGYRARYIAQTAAFLAERSGWLAKTETLPYAEARARLIELPGVGGKIADCVLLYGGGRLESFPTDTWILQAMARRYGLEAWKPEHVAQFGRVHFGPLAGLAQQYLFEAERAGLLDG